MAFVKITSEEWAKRKAASKARQRESQENYRQRNLDKEAAKARKWRAQNIDKVRARNKIYSIRSKARKRGVNPDQAVIDYQTRRIRREEIALSPPAEKKCTKCGKTKPRNAFPIRSQAVDGLESNCKYCRRETRRKWATRNLAKLNLMARQRYATSPTVREKSLMRVKSRKARMKGCHVRDLTALEWAEIKAVYSYRCAYCGQMKPLTQDHVIPISKGGEHTASNIVPACRSCNSRKGARLPIVPFQPHLLTAH
jgi:5-methylcytosine-specific restriction endonuclease McrA